MTKRTENVVRNRWSKASMFIHVLSALFIVGLGTAGFIMSDLPADSNTRLLLSRMHTMGGFLLMLLTLSRLVVRLRKPGPKPLDVEPLHRLGIRFIHTLLYIALFALGVTGIAMAQEDSWQEYLSGEIGLAPDLAELVAREAHETIVLVLFSLIFLHVAGVVVREVQRGDVLGRMFAFVKLAESPSEKGER